MTLKWRPAFFFQEIQIIKYMLNCPNRWIFWGKKWYWNVLIERKTGPRTFGEYLLAVEYDASSQKANKYFPILERILEEEGIPSDFKYLAVIESGLANVRSQRASEILAIMRTTGQWDWKSITMWMNVTIWKWPHM